MWTNKLDALLTAPDGNDTDVCGAEFDECFLFYFLICGVIGSIICIVGLFGNAVSLIVLQKVGKKNAVSVFLLKSLALTDSTFLIAYGFNWNVDALFNFSGREDITYSTYQYFWTYVVFPVYCAAITMSSWNVCLLTIHR